MNAKESEEEATAIKKNLLLDTSIEESHNRFVANLTGELGLNCCLAMAKWDDRGVNSIKSWAERRW